MSPQTIVIDCDPGIDDAIALLLALGSPEFNLQGITTVAGNVPVSLTTRNALRVLDLAQCPSVPVYAGCPVPLVRSPIFASDIHGADGLGGINLPDPQGLAQPESGVWALTHWLRHSPTPITIATLGPLTNLAVTLIQDPSLAKNIGQLVIMGGAIGQGNITTSAEFNFYADPQGAQVVFDRVAEFSIPTTVIGLDVTHQVLATPPYQQQIRALNNPASRAVLQMLQTYSQTPEANDRGFDGAPLHDPCVIAYLLQPDLFQTQSAHLTIETQSSLTLGRSAIDWNAPHSTLHIATGVNSSVFFEHLIEALSRF